MNIIVCGGRNYADRSKVFSTLDAIAKRGTVSIIEGGATGADALAREWRRSYTRGEHFTVRADWKRHGRAAGPIRNQLMLDHYAPTLVVAFPGGRGTADMVRRAKAAGVEVREVE